MGTADVTITFILHPLAFALFLVVVSVYLGYCVVKFITSIVTG